MRFILADGTGTYTEPEDLTDFLPRKNNQRGVGWSHELILVHKDQASKYFKSRIDDQNWANMSPKVAKFILSRLLPNKKLPSVLPEDGDITTRIYLLSYDNKDDFIAIMRMKDVLIKTEDIAFFYNGRPLFLQHETMACLMFALNLEGYLVPQVPPVDPKLDDVFLKMYATKITKEDLDYFRDPPSLDTIPTLVVKESSVDHVNDPDDHVLHVYHNLLNRPPEIVYGNCSDLRLLALAISNDMVYFSDENDTIPAKITHKSGPKLDGVTMSSYQSKYQGRATVTNYEVLPPRQCELELPKSYKRKKGSQ